MSLREKKPKYGVRMRENTDQKKLRLWTIFTQCVLQHHDAVNGNLTT